MSLTYEEPKQYSKNEIDETISNGDEKEISKMLVGLVFNESDFDYVYRNISSLYNSRSTLVISTIFECLGHLARIHKHLPDEVIAFYKQYKENEDLDIQCRLECFIDDVEIYIPELYIRMQQCV